MIRKIAAFVLLAFGVNLTAALLCFATLNCLAQIIVPSKVTGGQQRKDRYNRFSSPPDDPQPPGSGGFFFVAPNGTQNASGAIGDPWSFAYCLTQTVAGATDFYAFRNGTYTGDATDLFNLGRPVVFYESSSPLEVSVQSTGDASFVVANPVDPPATSAGVYINCFLIEKQ
jgi:hypothetical protein